MCKNLLKMVLLYALIIFALPSHSKAESEFLTRDDVFGFLHKAFQSQVALSEKERSLEEVSELLSPYFTEDYNKVFFKENLVSENGKYFTLGTDAAFYYIPFFAYSHDTKIVYEKDKMYVFEYFPENHEGPVGYKSHYEGLILEKTEGNWKVSEYLYDQVPESVIEKSKQEEGSENQLASSFSIERFPFGMTEPAIKMSVFFNPFEAFFQSGSLLLLKERTGIKAD